MIGSRWVQGARPRTLGAAVVPVLVGTSAAGHATVFRTLGCFVVAMSLQIGVNYANDYFDGVRGVDTAARVGPARLTASGIASPRAVARAAAISFGIAAVTGAWVAIAVRPLVAVIGAAAIVAAVGYSGGPKPYASRGMGEVFVFVFFGLAATAGTAYVQSGRVTAAVWLASVAVGLWAVAILLANNIRDIPTDTASGKRTLAARLGDGRARFLYAATVVVPFVLIAAGIAARSFPGNAVSCAFALPFAIPCFVVARRARDAGAVRLLPLTARAQIVFGLLLAEALWR